MKLLLSSLILAGSLLSLTAQAQPQVEFNSSASAFVEDPALLWSTYAPQLYFGIKPRLPKSITNGLMWFGLNDYEGLNRESNSSSLPSPFTRLTPLLSSLRSGVHHTTSSSPPHEFGLESYTYTSHIPRVGNTQRLIDSRNKLRVDTSFVNLNDGMNWGARVEMNGEEKTRMTGIWYISLEGEGRIRLVEQEDEQNVSRFVCTA